MVITVKVKPSSQVAKVSVEDSFYSVKLRSKPHEGKANEELIHLLADHFDVPKTCIRILKGVKGRLKVVEIDGYEDRKF